MRISEIEIYSSKQILTFIEYLKVLADEKKAIEDMQSHYALGAVGNANYLNQAAQATPEYYVKMTVAAQRAADQACDQPAETA